MEVYFERNFLIGIWVSRRKFRFQRQFFRRQLFLLTLAIGCPLWTDFAGATPADATSVFKENQPKKLCNRNKKLNKLRKLEDAPVQYRVKKGDDLSDVLEALNLDPLWGRGENIDQTVELNPTTIENHGNLIQPNSLITLPTKPDSAPWRAKRRQRKVVIDSDPLRRLLDQSSQKGLPDYSKIHPDVEAADSNTVATEHPDVETSQPAFFDETTTAATQLPSTFRQPSAHFQDVEPATEEEQSVSFYSAEQMRAYKNLFKNDEPYSLHQKNRIDPHSLEKTDPSFSRFSVKPLFSYSRLDSIDLASGTQATAASNLNVGLLAGWHQFWSDSFTTAFVIGGQNSEFYIASTSRTLSNPEHIFGQVSFESRIFLFPWLGFGLDLGIHQRPFLRGESSASNTIDSVPVPASLLTFFEILPLTAHFSLVFEEYAQYYTPVGEDLYQLRAGYSFGGKLYLQEKSKFDRSRSHSTDIDTAFVAGLFFEQTRQNSTIFAQQIQEIGLTFGFLF